jgi:hypothetical protein
MKLRSIALVLTVVFAFAAAQAQTGVYVTADTQQFTQEGVNAHPAPGGQVDSPWLFGTVYGVYYDVNRLPHFGKLKTGPVVFGIDGRGETFRLNEYGSVPNTYGGSLNRQDGLFSLRVATKKPIYWKSTPYLQGGFGVAHTKTPFHPTYTNNFIYQASLGFDRPIPGKNFHHVDWRVLEISANSLANFRTGYYNANGGAGNGQYNYTITFGTGLVFRSR